jgi:hypothetical protein
VARISLAVLSCIVASAFALSPERALGLPDLGDGKPATASAAALEGWSVAVSVEPTRLGPLVVSVGAIRPARTTLPGAWVEHDIVFTNRGDRPVHFADIGFSGFLPPRRPILVAGDRRCVPERSSLEIFCLLYIDPLNVAPHSSEGRTITLFKGLRGLRPLGPGTYVLRTPLRFRIVYEIEAAS